MNISSNLVHEEKTMAQAYTETLERLLAENPYVMQLEADLAVCLLGEKYKPLRDKYPQRVLNCGIQEANAVGVACGLSAMGRVPFVHSFAPFISRRANDQIFISGCYSGANVRLVGSDPGVMAAYNGGTHMPFEDIGALRSFPGMTILEPSDNSMLRCLMEQLVDAKGMFYLRTARKTMHKIYEGDVKLQIGKGICLLLGEDVTIIASGIMLAEAIKAAQMLKNDGISARVVDMFTIKPLDRELVQRCAAETGAIVTAENHNILGGLGSAVCEVVSETKPVPVERVGIEDSFGQVGDIPYLMQTYGLTAEKIAEKAKKAISRKAGGA